MEVMVSVLLLTGSSLALLAALGLQQFPDVFARMHAATKTATLGLVLVLSGAALQVEATDAVIKLLLIIGFQLITAPIAAHMIGRASYRAGTELSPSTQVDELAGAAEEPMQEERPTGDEAPALGQRLVAIGWLTVVWVALWGRLSVANLLGGVVLGLLLLAAFPALRPQALVGRLRPLRALRFGLFFSWKLVEASLVVAWEVITPNNEAINEGIVAVPVSATSDAMVTLIANAISLTPGTLTIEVDRHPTVLYVHVLHLRSIEQVRRDVGLLEWYAVRAFGTEEDVAAVDTRRAVKR